MKKRTPVTSHQALSNDYQELPVAYHASAMVVSEPSLLLTVKQAAALLNVSVATVYRLIQTEDIPSVLIRGSRRLSREALQQWIREQ